MSSWFGIPRCACATLIIGLVASIGQSSLKPKQLDVIDASLKENAVFVSLPTRHGKSLIFAMLPFLFDQLRGRSGSSIACIVSPLTALMLEQRGVFSQMELNCEFLGELQMDEAIFRKVVHVKCQLVILSLENLFTTVIS